ncbi:MAG: hypothetical protein K2H85_10870, partial [Allobaculum sp.]|nr:hypothetical protein [Allobaculum sp.]
TNALGTDLKKVIADETQKDYANIAALNADSVAQIIAAIDDIKESVKKNNQSEVDFTWRFEKIISDENQQLSGKINTLQNLVENGNQESRSAFRTIIDSQEEIKAILLSKVGLKVGHQEVKQMYHGKIPDKYIINDGFDGEFTCLYCGATAEHKVNSEQVCKCVVCGEKYYKIKLNRVDEVCEKYGKNKNDELLVTEEKILEWRKKHEAKVMCNGNSPQLRVLGKIIVIPEEYIKKYKEMQKPIALDFYMGSPKVVEVVIFPKFTTISNIGFKRLENLKAVICPGATIRKDVNDEPGILDDKKITIYQKIR